MASTNQNPPFKTIFFKPNARKIISLLCIILGYKNDEEVDETLLGLLRHLNHAPKECLNGICVVS